jgi:hypothetical protein
MGVVAHEWLIRRRCRLKTAAHLARLPNMTMLPRCGLARDVTKISHCVHEPARVGGRAEKPASGGGGGVVGPSACCAPCWRSWSGRCWRAGRSSALKLAGQDVGAVGPSDILALEMHNRRERYLSPGGAQSSRARADRSTGLTPCPFRVVSAACCFRPRRRATAAMELNNGRASCFSET